MSEGLSIERLKELAEAIGPITTQDRQVLEFVPGEFNDYGPDLLHKRGAIQRKSTMIEEGEA